MIPGRGRACMMSLSGPGPWCVREPGAGPKVLLSEQGRGGQATWHGVWAWFQACSECYWRSLSRGVPKWPQQDLPSHGLTVWLAQAPTENVPTSWVGVGAGTAFPRGNGAMWLWKTGCPKDTALPSLSLSGCLLWGHEHHAVRKTKGAQVENYMERNRSPQPTDDINCQTDASRSLQTTPVTSLVEPSQLRPQHWGRETSRPHCVLWNSSPVESINFKNVCLTPLSCGDRVMQH